MVDVVQQTAEEDVLTFNLKVIGIDSFYIVCTRNLAVGHVLVRSVTPDNRRDRFDSPYILADTLHISVAHVPRTAFVKAFVWFAGLV